ncbi:Phenylpyruvate tautomerase PptA, 4-oxalocrotonate tautomerase family [Nonomuraea solani]|uniref:Phenylpyruvate tautomerase PptA, 4-oxalocrotonate tautomerase family n=1 Tax=Nonomuraea solani TaxID=1144553 RepID=A0A1H6F0P5_9ACTN|nr:tautomerase family protein [Nonomuraea solani]SEH02729.1 Phenylpyruvate tautomerase PptA, 4-oxalocrotonate tautomerase family [Nonomuraea solani]
MAQVKVYGRRDVWAGRRREVSDLIQSCLVSAWGVPEAKRFHRFLLLDADDFVCPGRSERYLIIEVVCFTGRSDDAKRALIREIYQKSGYDPEDVEITIIEMPKVNWGIRGVPADELTLPYKVEV